ncbi:MAG: NAD(P)/FAD-dependent oxidoreductase [Opitutales bacterium]
MYGFRNIKSSRKKTEGGRREGGGGRLAVIGGGAAGFFAAITAAEANPSLHVRLFESGGRPLRKVAVSGGGRCNVTHACYDPSELAKHYPRGSRELRAALHQWQSRDTVQWFAERGVVLKTEGDGRMFPVTDDSATIIDCLREAASRAGVEVHKKTALRGLSMSAGGGFKLSFNKGEPCPFDKVCIAAGTLKGSNLAAELEAFGHTITPLAPSLFAFDAKDARLEGLAGLSVPEACVRILPKGAQRAGPVLVTHRGLSGPAILRLSAWEARALQACHYKFRIRVNWLASMSGESLFEAFENRRHEIGKKTVRNSSVEPIPKRLWERLVNAAGIVPEMTWAQLSKKNADALVRQVTSSEFEIVGKTTNKEEFVTCGGVSLKEVDFRTMGSKLVPDLHFAGECLDIDGITGGFNFQAAWTTGRIAGLALAKE